jgi:hypothetical protein
MRAAAVAFILFTESYATLIFDSFLRQLARHVGTGHC